MTRFTAPPTASASNAGLKVLRTSIRCSRSTGTTANEAGRSSTLATGRRTPSRRTAFNRGSAPRITTWSPSPRSSTTWTPAIVARASAAERCGATRSDVSSSSTTPPGEGSRVPTSSWARNTPSGSRPTSIDSCGSRIRTSSSRWAGWRRTNRCSPDARPETSNSPRASVAPRTVPSTSISTPGTGRPDGSTTFPLSVRSEEAAAPGPHARTAGTSRSSSLQGAAGSAATPGAVTDRDHHGVARRALRHLLRKAQRHGEQPLLQLGRQG